METNFYKNGVRWGIIGVGDVCEVKSAPAMNLIEGSKLVAVMRRNGEKAADYARRHNIPKWYDDAQKLINDPEVNAVYIATPPNVHSHYTYLAAKAGKAVYVEKPMARTYEECLEMISSCKHFGVPLFVAYYRRTLPMFEKIKQLLDEDVIGDVRFVDVKIHKPLQPDIVAANSEPNWRVLPEVGGGGYFYDLAAHQLDILDFLLGEIKSASGFAANQTKQYAAEDIVVGSFHFKNGVMGQGSWWFSAPLSKNEEMITIFGSKGQIAFPCFGNFHIALKLEGQIEKITTYEMPKHIQLPLIQTVVDELMAKGTCPSTGISGARTSRILEEICHYTD